MLVSELAVDPRNLSISSSKPDWIVSYNDRRKADVVGCSPDRRVN